MCPTKKDGKPDPASSWEFHDFWQHIDARCVKGGDGVCHAEVIHSEHPLKLPKAGNVLHIEYVVQKSYIQLTRMSITIQIPDPTTTEPDRAPPLIDHIMECPAQ